MALCPDRQTLDRYFNHLIDTTELPYYAIVALFRAVPAWLQFLEEKNLVSAAERERVLVELKELHAEWCEFFKDKDVCVGPVYTVAETFQDPQVVARKMVVDIEDTRYGKVRQAGVAIKLSETPGSIRCAGPVVGEHTETVLTALGYSVAERAQLRQAGTVA